MSKRKHAGESKEEKKSKKIKTEPVQMVVHAWNDAERFEPGDAKALDFLADHGFVIFRNVLDSKQVDHSIGLFWDFIEAASKGRAKRNDPKTWTNANWPGIYKRGCIMQNGIGQSPAAWSVRTAPNVLKCWQTIWRTDESKPMLCSLDSIGYFRGAEHKINHDRNWLHVDQHPGLLSESGASFQGALLKKARKA